MSILNYKKLGKINKIIARLFRRYTPKFYLSLLNFYRLPRIELIIALGVYFFFSGLISLVLIAADRYVFDQHFYKISTQFQQEFEHQLHQNELVLASLVTIFENQNDETWSNIRPYTWKVVNDYDQIRGIQYFALTPHSEKRALSLLFSEPTDQVTLFAPTYDLLRHRHLGTAASVALQKNYAISSEMFTIGDEFPSYFLLQVVRDESHSQTVKKGVIGIGVDVQKMLKLANRTKQLHLKIQQNFTHFRLNVPITVTWPTSFPEPKNWWQHYNFYSEVHASSMSQPFVVNVLWQPNIPIRTYALFCLFWTIPAVILLFVLLDRAKKIKFRRANDLRTQRYLEDRELARMTLVAIREGVLVFDAAHRLRSFNSAALELLNKKAHQLLGKSVTTYLEIRRLPLESLPFPMFGEASDRIPELPEDQSLILYCMEHDLTVELGEQFVLTNHFGVILPLEGLLCSVHNESRQRVGSVLTFRDISALKQRTYAALAESQRKLREHEAQLAHAGRLHSMSELATNIAHEINQPLSAILSYSQAAMNLLDEEGIDSDTLRYTLSAIETQSQRAGEIIKGLRAFVKQRDTFYDSLNINELIKTVLSLFQPQWAEKHEISLEVLLDDGMPEIFADRIQLEQILINLLSNAAEAVQSKFPWGRIQIESHFDEHNIWISVEDNGIGVSKAIKQQIFLPFFTTKSKGGMGLGLTICQSLAKSRGGNIDVESVDGGAKFILRLPRELPMAFKF